MPQELSPEQKKMAALILSIVLFIGAAIVIARAIFPIALVASIIGIVLLIVVGACELFLRDHTEFNVWHYASTYVGIFCIVALTSLGLTYAIGYGLGGTSFGGACVQVYEAYTGIDMQVQQAIDQFVTETCKSLTAEQCNDLQTAAKAAKTLQDVEDIADKLKTAAQAISRNT